MRRNWVYDKVQTIVCYAGQKVDDVAVGKKPVNSSDSNEENVAETEVTKRVLVHKDQHERQQVNEVCQLRD